MTWWACRNGWGRIAIALAEPAAQPLSLAPDECAGKRPCGESRRDRASTGCRIAGLALCIAPTKVRIARRQSLQAHRCQPYRRQFRRRRRDCPPIRRRPYHGGMLRSRWLHGYGCWARCLVRAASSAAFSSCDDSAARWKHLRSNSLIRLRVRRRGIRGVEAASCRLFKAASMPLLRTADSHFRRGALPRFRSACVHPLIVLPKPPGRRRATPNNCGRSWSTRWPTWCIIITGSA